MKSCGGVAGGYVYIVAGSESKSDISTPSQDPSQNPSQTVGVDSDESGTEQPARNKLFMTLMYRENN